jgi:hypothetical protein
MIRYDLVCGEGHAFDSWFRDSASYDRQAAEGLLNCPQCGSTQISKQLMTPGIPTKGNRRAEAPSPPATPEPALPESPARMFAGPIEPRQQVLLRMMRELRKEIESKADYVGDKFAEEARKIHYEEAEKRGIYGEATAEDAKSLIDEGIEVHQLPKLPEDGN